ncbi:MAG TPA: protein kinase [Polyangiaceae bacterium]|nr:protein kinase [Polyangiaceae bacterium]
MMESAAAEIVGQTIAGRYRILRLVGEGGVGRVYEAEQVLGSSPRSVALKLLRPEWSHDAAVQARFHREAALVAKLQHVNTVRIYDFGATSDGTLYIAMEFLRGRSLQRLLDERGALPPARVERIVQQVAASLQEAHDAGIIHRDLKPDNILMLEGHGSEHDMVKLLDFGIAKGRPSSGTALTKLTALGTFVGTPAYMSPEQFGGDALGPESDVYSLGVTSHQMLSGRLPFDAQSAMQWAQAHLGSAAPALAGDYGAGAIPESMRRAVLHALAKEPAQRPASASQFAREFSGADVPPPAPGAPAPVPAASHALSEPFSVEARRGAAALPPAVGGPRTAPMTRVPDFAAPAPAVPPTLPIHSPPPPRPVTPAARGGGVKLLVGAATVLGVAFFALLAQQQGWFSSAGQSASPPEAPGEGAPPAPVVIAPQEPAPVAPESPPRPVEPSAPADRAPAKPPPSRPTSPATPAAKPPAAGAPNPPGIPPILPGPSAPPTGPSAPTGPAQPPANPALPPGVLPPGVQLPELQLPPIQLPSAEGACERCLETLRKGGNGSVVSAAADDLLCSDHQGSQACQAQIRELSPPVAEQAARAGDCAAALATEAAGLRLGVDQERFRTVHTLCVR